MNFIDSLLAASRYLDALQPVQSPAPPVPVPRDNEQPVEHEDPDMSPLMFIANVCCVAKTNNTGQQSTSSTSDTSSGITERPMSADEKTILEIGQPSSSTDNIMDVDSDDDQIIVDTASTPGFKSPDLPTSTSVSGSRDDNQNKPPNVKKAKKRGKCVACGDKANGMHFGALACEGCKGFFRRTIVQKKTYKCYYDNNCVISVVHRGRCQACRLNKCLAKGMRKEMIKKSRRANSQTKNAEKMASERDFLQMDENLRAIVDNVIEANRKIYHDVINKSKAMMEGSRCGGFISRVALDEAIAFCKNVSFLNSLEAREQEALCRPACNEIMILRFADCYVPEHDIFFCPRHNYKISSSELKAELGPLANMILAMTKEIKQQEFGSDELAIFLAYRLFSWFRKGNFKNRNEIEEIERQFLSILMTHLRNRQSNSQKTSFGFVDIFLKLQIIAKAMKKVHVQLKPNEMA